MTRMSYEKQHETGPQLLQFPYQYPRGKKESEITKNSNIIIYLQLVKY